MDKKAQSIIEYVLMALLVVAGIVLMGPYVLRSVNAHFKLWDEGAQDSFEENLNQALVNAVPPIDTQCKCTPVETCGGSSINTGACPHNDMQITYNCRPLECNGGNKTSCVPDPRCCTTPWDIGCGTVPLPLEPNGSVNTHPPTTPLNGNCYYGQEISQTVCGNNTTVTCAYSSACPLPQCTGTLPNGATYCQTNSSTPPGPTVPCLTANLAISFANNNTCPAVVTDSSRCANADPCEFICADGQYDTNTGECDFCGGFTCGTDKNGNSCGTCNSGLGLTCSSDTPGKPGNCICKDSNQVACSGVENGACHNPCSCDTGGYAAWQDCGTSCCGIVQINPQTQQCCSTLYYCDMSQGYCSGQNNGECCNSNGSTGNSCSNNGSNGTGGAGCPGNLQTL